MRKISKFLLFLAMLCLILSGCSKLAAGQGNTNSSRVQTGTVQKNADTVNNVPLGKFLTIKLLDVGHGDSILLQGDGKTVLIDTGDTGANDIILRKLHENNVKSIDALIITHYHSDHSGGLSTVLRNFKVSHVYDAGVVNKQSQFVQKIFQDYEEGRWVHTQLRRGDKIVFNDNFYFVVLSPGKELLPKGKKDYGHYLNNNSLVLKMHYNNFQMLFTGDMEAAAEYQVMRGYPAKDLHVDVLKVAHHGSKTSSTWDWLNTVKPTWGVISCGGDPTKYQHPDPKILSTYQYLGIKVVTTKQNGDLVITTDGKNYNVKGTK